MLDGKAHILYYKAMFSHRKKLQALWAGVSILAVISMLAYLLLPLAYTQ